jgi:hypothetical protein
MPLLKIIHGRVWKLMRRSGSAMIHMRSFGEENLRGEMPFTGPHGGR